MPNRVHRVIPENFRKKQDRDAKLLKALKDKKDKSKKERAEKRKVYEANAEKYYKEYEQTAQALVDAKRKAKAEGNYYIEGQPKVAFAIRTRG